MKKRYYKLLVLSLALLALVVSGIYNELAVKTDSKINITSSNDDVELIVHISGAIENEGVYNMKVGSRVGDLLEISGGLKTSADMSNVNLAEQLKDGQKIYIPPLKKETIKTSDDNASNNDSEKIRSLTLEEFNVLSQSELEKLPGVGPVIAEKIYDYRNKNGSFMSIDDLVNVSGIGDKKLKTIEACFK
ncbi:MAG: helix-hairpin-helix domain-containing protein [Acidaminobacteraceae bacterium]